MGTRSRPNWHNRVYTSHLPRRLHQKQLDTPGYDATLSVQLLACHTSQLDILTVGNSRNSMPVGHGPVAPGRMLPNTALDRLRALPSPDEAITVGCFPETGHNPSEFVFWVVFFQVWLFAIGCSQNESSATLKVALHLDPKTPGGSSSESSRG